MVLSLALKSFWGMGLFRVIQNVCEKVVWNQMKRISVILCSSHFLSYIHSVESEHICGYMNIYHVAEKRTTFKVKSCEATKRSTYVFLVLFAIIFF